MDTQFLLAQLYYQYVPRFFKVRRLFLIGVLEYMVRRAYRHATRLILGSG